MSETESFNSEAEVIVPDAPDLTDPEVRKALINTETAKIAWSELQRYFASGATIYVSPALSLVAVGADVLADNNKAIEQWMAAGKLCAVSDQQAGEWLEANALMWAVVLSPWVFVQPILSGQELLAEKSSQ